MKVILSNPLLAGSFLLLLIIFIALVVVGILFPFNVRKYTLEEAHKLVREKSKGIVPMAIAIVIVDIFTLTVIRGQYEGRLSFQTIIWITAGVSAFALFILTINILGVIMAKKRIRELEPSFLAQQHSHVDHQELR